MDNPHAAGPDHYLAPGRFTTRVFNPTVAWLTRHGVSVLGSRVLAVRGRSSGQWRETPVNLLSLDGEQYLVSPRGSTQWVRNLRAAGEGRLRVGHRSVEFKAVELADSEKPPVLRAYLRRWRFEVGQFFDGVGPGASDDELTAVGPKHPVFRVTTTA